MRIEAALDRWLIPRSLPPSRPTNANDGRDTRRAAPCSLRRPSRRSEVVRRFGMGSVCRPRSSVARQLRCGAEFSLAGFCIAFLKKLADDDPLAPEPPGSGSARTANDEMER